MNKPIKITFELVVNSLYSQSDYKLLYNQVRLNDDGTDKIDCLYKYFNKRFLNIDYEVILGVFHINFVTMVNKWAGNIDNADIDDFHNFFIKCLWTKVFYRLLDVVRKNGFHYDDESLRNFRKVKVMEQVNGAVTFDEKLHNCDFMLIDDSFIYIDRLNKVIEALPPDRYRWKKILKWVLMGKTAKEIARRLHTHEVTIKTDIKKLITVFDNLNKIE